MRWTQLYLECAKLTNMRQFPNTLHIRIPNVTALVSWYKSTWYKYQIWPQGQYTMINTTTIKDASSTHSHTFKIPTYPASWTHKNISLLHRSTVYHCIIATADSPLISLLAILVLPETLQYIFHIFLWAHEDGCPLMNALWGNVQYWHGPCCGKTTSLFYYKSHWVALI